MKTPGILADALYAVAVILVILSIAFLAGADELPWKMFPEMSQDVVARAPFYCESEPVIAFLVERGAKEYIFAAAINTDAFLLHDVSANTVAVGAWDGTAAPIPLLTWKPLPVEYDPCLLLFPDSAPRA